MQSCMTKFYFAGWGSSRGVAAQQQNVLCSVSTTLGIPYLFGYKTGVSPLQNDYKYLNQLYVILL